MFLMIVEMRKGMKVKLAYFEIGQYWISSPSVGQLKGYPKGHATVVGLQRTLGYYVDSFHRGRKVTRVMYDYRTQDGDLFSVVAPTLRECRHKRDEWLAKRNK